MGWIGILRLGNQLVGTLVRFVTIDSGGMQISCTCARSSAGRVSPIVWMVIMKATLTSRRTWMPSHAM